MLDLQTAGDSADATLLPHRTITIAAIIGLIAKEYGLTRADIIGRGRTRRIAWPRMEAMWLCRRHTNHSLPEIGTRFGDRDHTTVLHAERTVEKRLTDSRKAELDMLVKGCRGLNPVAERIALEIAACREIVAFIIGAELGPAIQDCHSYSTKWAMWARLNRSNPHLARSEPEQFAIAAA